MKNFNRLTAARLALFLIVAALVVGLAWPLAGVAQDKPGDHGKHKHSEKSADTGKDLATQVRDLQAKVATLEAALKQGHQGKAAATPPAAGTGHSPAAPGGMKKGMGKMGHMDMGGGMSGMAGKGAGGMGMMGMGMEGAPGGAAGMAHGDTDMMEMMGMMGMGPMGKGGMAGMDKMRKVAALPGFPGASHIYHIGATGFFLDHPEHITLTADQKRTLAGIKEKALLGKASSQRKVEEAEQELWALTASDRPDAGKIEAKVREVERLRGDQRLTFIRAVGEAAKVLTDGQRKALLGMNPEKGDTSGPHTGH
jgi:Spy/CpxP family protein refolding chaperone/outer membrane murein-binding lipoprotein Lpp